MSVLVPAYNEAAGIEKAVRSLAASDYPEFEVVVIDDGSTDGTGELVDGLGLSRVRVIREANRGKAAALNTGLAAARHELIAAVDADTVFEPQSLTSLVRPLADERVGAVAGNTKVGNRNRLLGRWQHIEYVTGVQPGPPPLRRARLHTDRPGRRRRVPTSALRRSAGSRATRSQRTPT